MLVNKTVEFFLSEVAGRGGMPAGGEAGQAAGSERPGIGRDAGRGPRLGLKQDASDQITWAGSEKINSKESAL